MILISRTYDIIKGDQQKCQVKKEIDTISDTTHYFEPENDQCRENVKMDISFIKIYHRK